MKSRDSNMILTFTRILSYFVKYSAYNFLTATVLLTFGVLVFDYITIWGPQLPFLQYFSFLFPDISTSTISIGVGDIMRAYSLLSMIFFILSLAGRGLVRGLRRLSYQGDQSGAVVETVVWKKPLLKQAIQNISRRLLFSSIPISLIFLITFVALPFAKLANSSDLAPMYLIFGLFFAIAMVSNVIYIAIDGVSDLLLGWANSQSGMQLGQSPSL